MIIGLWMLVSFIQDLSETTAPKYSEIRNLFQQEQVKSFTLEENTLNIVLNISSAEGTRATITYELADVQWFKDDLGELIEQQYQDGILDYYDYIPGFTMPNWMGSFSTLFVVLVLVLLYIVLFRRPKENRDGSGNGGGGGGMGGPGGNFGKSRAKPLDPTKEKVTFAQVAGAKEEKEELEEIVAFLKNPDKFTKLGARIPKGILLVGPPGTGKTLLAKAVAGEAGVQFLTISGSDFVELYVGVGASRVRDLFRDATKNSPCIIFIDEIDAVGRRRGAGLGGGHDEREQTLNQLLVEMDGFSGNTGVIVMAATNRQDILDPALLRPGRFDREIYVGYPDILGREEILRVHSKKKPLADDVNLKQLAGGTVGFTGADLENLLNEGALLAAREDRPAITKSDLHEAMMKVLAGPEKKSRVVTEASRKLTAYHEAGHAIVINQLKTQDPVHQITIIPRGTAGGMTISLPVEDRSYQSKTELEERITSLLGGRVAEALFLGDISTGASNDIERATAIARGMVMKYGMSNKLGTINYETGSDEIFIGRSMGQARSYSESVATEIDQEVLTFIEQGYKNCEVILEKYRSEMELVANYLLVWETMEKDAFQRVFTNPSWIEDEIARGKAEQEKNQEEKMQAETEQSEENQDKKNQEDSKK
ncbi:MAG: ATP-dependent zinc metalloprotease FtsH [Eubacteriales bacterium]